MSVLPVGFGSSGGVDIGDNIANSLMLDSGASQYLSRTFGTPTNNTVWTFSFWIKRAKISRREAYFSDSAWTHGFSMNAADTIAINGSATITSTAVLRTPDAWDHIVAVNNGTTSTVYVNNLQILTGTTTITLMNSAGVKYLFGQTSVGGYSDGYFANVHFIDGQALTPSNFGSTSTDTGQWVPKTYTGTYGANGFKLDFSNSGALGTDSSGNGNNWTLNGGITSANQYTDTPTNNYCVLNTLDKSAALVVSKGNLSAALTVANQIVKASFGLSSGKWYWEVVSSTAVEDMIGVSNAAAVLTAYCGNNANGWAYYKTNGNKYNNATGVAYGASYTSGDIIGVALDIDAGTLTFYKNNVSQGVAFSGLSGPLFPTLSTAGAGGTQVAKFDASKLAYTPPTGFNALCTANLPTPAIIKPSTGFQAVLATGANIDANLATARSGWSGYVDIKKDRTASGNWRYQFSHDSSNEYSLAASSVTYQAKSTQSGANNFVGYSIRIGAAYGTAAGSVSHTNGVTTTVTHSLGISSKQMIFLFPRAGGTKVTYYHPAMTAGSLMNWVSSAIQAADVTIKTILSTSFQIDSTVASGTYDYLVLTELSGFLNLFTWTGNNSADGPFSYTDGKPWMLAYGSREGSAHNRVLWDSTRDTYNAVSKTFLTTTNDPEAVSDQCDLVSTGHKLRVPNGSAQGSNVAGEVGWGVAFLESHIKYSTAR